MAFFLAAIAAFLFIRVLGAWDASLGTIVTKRGCLSVESDAGVSKSVKARAKRCVNATSERVGASPSVRKLLRRTGKRT